MIEQDKDRKYIYNRDNTLCMDGRDYVEVNGLGIYVLLKELFEIPVCDNIKCAHAAQ